MSIIQAAPVSVKSVAELEAAQNAISTEHTAKGMKDQFLKLLITQLRNQDPLNPMDNAQITSQLAQISTVEGLENLNSNIKNNLKQISGQIDFSQSMAAVALINKEVLIPGNKVALGTNHSDPTVREATPFGVELNTKASTLTVNIKDAAGKVVRSMAFKDQVPGVLSLNWDGLDASGNTAPDGAYTIDVQATDSDGKALDSFTALTYGKVNSVVYSPTGLRLDLGLGGQVSMLDLRKVYGG